MRLTRAGEYAVRCVLYLASKEQGIVVSRKEVAGAMEIPDQFLSKIARQLAHSGIMEIIQGARGGYRLLIPLEKLTLLDVVESVAGEIFLNDCLMSPSACFRDAGCSVNRIWDKARNQLRNTLREATFDKLLAEDSCIAPLLTSLDEESGVCR